MKNMKFNDALADLLDRAKDKVLEDGHMTAQDIVSELIGAAFMLDPRMARVSARHGGRPGTILTNLADVLDPEQQFIEDGYLSAGDAFYIRVDDERNGFSIEPLNGVSPQVTRDTLRECAETFADYERQHLAKGTVEGDKKARRNRAMVEKCLIALGEPVDTPIPAARKPQESDSALPAPETPADPAFCAVAAIRATLDDMMEDDAFSVPNDHIGHGFEAIDQLLGSLMVVTDADIPAYLRTLASGAMRHKMPDTATAFVAAAESIEKGLHVGPEDPWKALGEITDMIGDANVKAGWWSDANLDLRTCDYAPHVFAGKMMLVVSEVSEAMEGHRKSKPGAILMDDHLPHRPMVEVEFADAHIRLFDLGKNYRLPGGGLLDVPGAIREKLVYNAEREDHKLETRAAAGGKTI